jgi:hypothetical protein
MLKLGTAEGSEEGAMLLLGKSDGAEEGLFELPPVLTGYFT